MFLLNNGFSVPDGSGFFNQSCVSGYATISGLNYWVNYLSGQVSGIQSVTGNFYNKNNPSGFISTGNNNYPVIQRLRTTSNNFGIYNWVYPFSYASGVIPIIQVAVEANTTDTWDSKMTYVNNTGCGILIQRGAAVTILGISVLSLPVGSIGTIHLMAISP